MDALMQYPWPGLVMALCFAAGTLFGPAQARTPLGYKVERIDLVAAGVFNIKAEQPDLKITKVQKINDHIVYITVAER